MPPRPLHAYSASDERDGPMSDAAALVNPYEADDMERGEVPGYDDPFYATYMNDGAASASHDASWTALTGAHDPLLPGHFAPAYNDGVLPTHHAYAAGSDVRLGVGGGYDSDMFEHSDASLPDQIQRGGAHGSQQALRAPEYTHMPAYPDTTGPESAAPGYPPTAADEDLENYGRIPQRQPRRFRTVRRVPLRNGHLVLDCPVPPKLLHKLPVRDAREFSHMRYTAVTSRPDDFAMSNYTLRQTLFEPPRVTELFIVLTLYNEDDKLLARSLHGVMSNVAYLCSRNEAQWGREGWKRVVVCIVADGRQKVNSRTLSMLATLGVYQEGVATSSIHGKPVHAHLYEYTTQFSVDTSAKFRGQERGIVPVQVLFCVKERNEKKINSHRWAFNAFGPVLQPNVCILLDVGTMPRPRSIYHLWRAFDRDADVGGACGEIAALKGTLWHALLNPLVAAQNFEYKMSNILDKPMESAFGYITVLPGAFSAYRYAALQNDKVGNGPLCSYFKGETLQGGSTDADIFSSNMYLAEDRILCWELVSKRDCAWKLKYVKSAQAVTDVPDRAPELITQRRRWLNGSFFAGIHSIIKFGYIYRSSHSFGRKFALHIEMLYQLVQLLFSWYVRVQNHAHRAQVRDGELLHRILHPH